MNARDRSKLVKWLTTVMIAYDGDITIDPYDKGEKITLDFRDKVSCTFILHQGTGDIIINWFGATSPLNPEIFTHVNQHHHCKATTFANSATFMDFMKYYATAIKNGEWCLTD